MPPRILLDIHRGDIELQDVSEGYWRPKIHRKTLWILAALYFGPILVQSTTEWGPLDQDAKDKDYNRAKRTALSRCTIRNVYHGSNATADQNLDFSSLARSCGIRGCTRTRNRITLSKCIKSSTFEPVFFPILTL
jgi:hypothetical protein